MSRSMSLVALLLAIACLILPPPTYAASYRHGDSRVHANGRSHHPGRLGAKAACKATLRSRHKASPGSGAKHAIRSITLPKCAASSRIVVWTSRSKRRSDVRKQFAPHSVGDIFGVGSFVTQRSWTVSPLIVGRARELGTKWVREEFTASRLHTGTSGRYSWADYDRIVNEERRAGLHILGLLDYSNTWTFHDHGTMPHGDIQRLASDFARYAHDVVRHFRGRVRYWEIWNEPNLDAFWHPTPDANDYAILLNSAGSAMHTADPRSQIVLAGTSGIDLPFIRAVAAHTHRFDIVAVHPYRDLPEPSFLRQVKALRSLHKPIWFSEIGWPAGAGCDACYGQVEQARYLVRFYTLAAAAGIQRVFWYDLRDDPHVASSPEAHFGLLRLDLSAKPAFAAYAYLSRLLDGSRYLGADWLGRHGLYVLRFEHGATHLSVLWNASNTTRTVTLKWKYSLADFVNAGGDVLAELTPRAGSVTVIAPQGGEPFYLVDRLPSYHVPSLGPLLHLAPPPPPPTPRPGSGVARQHPAPRVSRTARAASIGHRTRSNHTTPIRHIEHRVPTPKPRGTPTLDPSSPVPSVPPAP